MVKKRYIFIDLIRVVCCFAILFYHLNIMNGGYLAVCVFFVLTGYLNTISSLKKKKFSLIDYYKNRFIKIYLPMAIVVFLSVSVISLIKVFNWINLKPEVLSILLGYNNYWQLNANLDYFIRNISSPFMHMWFISLLIQFEIFFPFVLIILNKIKDKTYKIVPCILLFILGLLSYLLFLKNIYDKNLLFAYYDTFSRLFSIIFGVLLGYIHDYFKPFMLKNKFIYILYFIVLIIMFIFIDSSSSLLGLSMIIVTIISMRLIDYGVVFNTNHLFDNIISYISSITYEIYLVQYPIIFIFQYINISGVLKIILVVFIIFLLSSLIHYLRDFKKKNVTKYVGIIILFIFVFFGVFKFISAKDYTSDMENLERDLNKNRELIKKREKEYLDNSKKEKAELDKLLKSGEHNEGEVLQFVSEMKLVGIGDSIMELTIKDLEKEFPNGYFDGVVNRTERKAMDLLKELSKKDLLGDAVLFSLGTNDSNCNRMCKEELLKLVGDRKLFWVNATNPDSSDFNPGLEEFANAHDNVYIIDWVSVCKQHPEYLVYDKVHPSVRGCSVYAKTIFDKIYSVYLDEYKKNINDRISKYEEISNNRYTFIGNDLLGGIYDNLNNKYENSIFIIDNGFTYKTLMDKLKKSELSNNVILVFDNTINLREKDYKKIIKLLNGKNVYIVTTSDIDNVNIIKFNYSKYTIFDNIHLSNKGNRELFNKIANTLK